MEVVQAYVAKEREAGRLLGPFHRGEMHLVEVSPFGVKPKSEPGKWRLILDLSSPDGFSVNDGIKNEFCSLSYLSVNVVAKRVVQCGRGALIVKFNLKMAYRNVPVVVGDAMGGSLVCGLSVAVWIEIGSSYF